MSSRRIASKSAKIPHSSHESVHDDDEVIPKAEFASYSVRLLPAEQEFVSLDTVREYCQVPDEVEFRIPRLGESADNPPEGYFTCYKAHLVNCLLRFLMTEVIIHSFNRFGLSISQMTLTGLQHLIGILVLSYKQGMVLDSDYFETFLRLHQSSGTLMYCLTPQKFMLIVKKTISNGHEWRECFFFVCINNASIAESCISIFRSEWKKHDAKPLWLWPQDLTIVRDLLRGDSFYWSSFSPQRVRRVLACHDSRDDPQTIVEEEADQVMEEFYPRDAPLTSQQARLPKNKKVAFDDSDFPAEDILLPRWGSNFAPNDGSGSSNMPFPDCDSGACLGLLPLDLDASPTLDELPRSKTFAEGLHVFNSALKAIYSDTRLSCFKVEQAEKEVARMQSVAAAHDLRDWDLAKRNARALRRTERQGRRRIVAATADHSAQFVTEYGKLKEAQELVGDYCECRGSVCTLWCTQEANYTFES
ncbi:hypothetical protein N665_0434s0002 [Sinapis alba]|nr:hypothetical protein N665_0434s0002 [Sinapis alba]